MSGWVVIGGTFDFLTNKTTFNDATNKFPYFTNPKSCSQLIYRIFSAIMQDFKMNKFQ